MNNMEIFKTIVVLILAGVFEYYCAIFMAKIAIKQLNSYNE